MKNYIIVGIIMLLNFTTIYAQKGMFSLGLRNTVSAFNSGAAQNYGLGIGGQFRIQINDRINSEWFADYINSKQHQQVFRNDAHIGWSILYYLQKKQNLTISFFQPYIQMGHCFDFTQIGIVNSLQKPLKRWSSALQLGIGTHFLVSKKFDISIGSQYMIHLGNDIDTKISNEQIVIEQKNGNISWEGHWLNTISINYKIKSIF